MALAAQSYRATVAHGFAERGPGLERGREGWVDITGRFWGP